MHNTGKTPSFLAFVIVVSALLLMSIGCQSVTSGKFLADTQSLAGLSKGQVYERLGLPDKVIYTGDANYLYYIGTRSKGGGVLVGNPMVISFYFRRANFTSDTQILRIENDHVVQVMSFDNTQKLHYGFWPF